MMIGNQQTGMPYPNALNAGGGIGNNLNQFTNNLNMNNAANY